MNALLPFEAVADRRMVQIVVYGPPVPKGRPRVAVRGGRAMAYTPSKTRRYEDLIRLAAGDVMEHQPMLEGALTATVAVFVPIPASWSGKKKREAAAGTVVPTTKPDCDNYLKTVDALNEIVFKDDSQIVDSHVSKRYSDRPRLEITVVEGVGL